MWIRVISADGKKIVRILISKLAKIEELRKLLVKEFNVSVDQQRLFYRGKRLEDGHSLFDYDVQLNDIIQIFIRHSDANDSETRTTGPGCLEGKNSQEIKEGSSEKLADGVECAENDGDSVEESVDHKYFKHPEGFVPEDNSNSSAAGASEKGPEKARKRKHSDGGENYSEPRKQPAFSLTKETEKIIQEDIANKKIWDECLEYTHAGSQVFLKKVEDNFLCVCCQELVFRPITTQCSHNVCKTCLERSFKAKIFSCPMCRQDLEAGCIKKINGKLQDILLSLFPGYSAGR